MGLGDAVETGSAGALVAAVAVGVAIGVVAGAVVVGAEVGVAVGSEIRGDISIRAVARTKSTPSAVDPASVRLPLTAASPPATRKEKLVSVELTGAVNTRMSPVIVGSPIVDEPET